MAPVDGEGLAGDGKNNCVFTTPTKMDVAVIVGLILAAASAQIVRDMEPGSLLDMAWDLANRTAQHAEIGMAMYVTAS